VGRKQWALTTEEQLELSSVESGGRKPDEWSPAPMRVATTPESVDVPLERRHEIALAVYVSEIDPNLEIALRSFRPDDLWNLLRALQQAEHGVGRNRMSAVQEGEAEYRAHADQFVLAWRDCRRLRLRLVGLARQRGLRGFDDPSAPRYRNSLPPESQHLLSLTSVENLLLSQAGYRVALWLTQRKHISVVDRARHLVRTRREIVALLASAGLSYERVASMLIAA
jgi:hypothetical protein